MAKDNKKDNTPTPEATAGAEATATAGTPAKERSKRGSSLASRIKANWSKIVTALQAGAEITTDLIAEAEALLAEAPNSGDSSLPLADQLVNVQTQIKAHYELLKAGFKTPEDETNWEEKQRLLLNRQHKVKTAIANANKPKEDKKKDQGETAASAPA